MTILETIRAILKFKDDTTIAEIAGIAEVRKAYVLAVLNDNDALVIRDRKTGKITGERAREAMRLKMYGEGKWFQTCKENYGCINALKFEGHEELKAKFRTTGWEGGFGDCREITFIPDTPEVRAALAAEGCIANPLFTDHLWRE